MRPGPSPRPPSSRGTKARAAPAPWMRCASASPAPIKGWIDRGEMLASAGRPITAGDILILVRRREPFTAPMIRALKREGIAVAGADRMRLMDQLAVQDLVALADVLLMPEDDLALAVTLKSPLFGLDDDALFDLAHGRGRVSLWSALKDTDDPRFQEAATRLKAWLSQADLSPPYEFFAALLGADGQAMRKRMLTRLGPGGGRGDRRIPRRERLPTTGRRRLRCKASSISCAPATSRSSATWSRTATRCAS